MKTKIIGLAIVTLLLFCKEETKITQREIKQYSIEQFMDNEAVLGRSFSADSVRLKGISPLFHTDKVTKPLIVLQGSKDPRVLQVESDEIVAGVRKK